MTQPTIRTKEFGVLQDGNQVSEYELDNGTGLVLKAINLGGIVTALHVPDRQGRSANVVLGFSALADYVERNLNFGVIVGRVANRIAGARFALDGIEHKLTRNDGPNTLHGGARGFGARWWKATPAGPDAQGNLSLRLDYTSADGEEGFPGRLDASVTYTVMPGNASGNQPGNEWRIDYRATCDRATVVNLSHHEYFNLAGGGTALGHRLTLPASRYTTVDRHLIPVDVESVQGTPFDFREPMRVGERIRSGHPQLALARGYDHNWVLDRSDRTGPGLSLAARLQDDDSGRLLEIETTEPALQFYSGNFLDGTLLGSGGQLYRQGDGVCLEPQHHPNAPNRPDFPSVVLRPGEVYESCTIYRFSVI